MTVNVHNECHQWFKNIWYTVCHGGKSFLYDLEVFVLKNMLASLDGNDKDNFLQQLSKLDLVQRSPDGKIVALFEAKDTYFKSWDSLLLTNKTENLLAYKVKIAGSICPKKSLIVEVFLHEGRISSIEYKDKMNWPKTQKKISLAQLDWSICEKKGLRLISSVLLL